MPRGKKQQQDDDLIGRVLALKELLTYQAHTVVSRALVQKEKGSVTMFAFDKGTGLSEHTSPLDAMVQVLEGEAEIIIAGKAHRVKEGEMLIMPTEKPHSLKAVEKFKMLLTMIRPETTQAPE